MILKMMCAAAQTENVRNITYATLTLRKVSGCLSELGLSI